MDDPAAGTGKRPGPTVTDLEIKDATLIFNAVCADLVQKYGKDKLRFPREFIWLGGAPGAGKGTNTPFIIQARGITAAPIVISDLLTSPQAVAIKNAGHMVGDREVIGLLFEELLDPKYHDGVIVDGFPRTMVQVECLKLFFHTILDLHNEHRATPLGKYFRKPMFRITLLFVSEEVSVQRQLKRGREIREHNRLVRESGVGQLREERVTDLDPELCRRRYQTFKETTFEALQSLRQIFHFHYIDAEGELPEVQANILNEFSYQSSLELTPSAFDLIRHIPVASQLARHARQELVERIDSYVEDPERRPLFECVLKLVEEKMIPIVRAHAISGHARINSEHELLDNPETMKMLIDVLSERGFHATVDVHRMYIPERVDLTTGEIRNRIKKVFRIEIRFPPSEIRRGH
jgi:adenylate kinase